MILGTLVLNFENKKYNWYTKEEGKKFYTNILLELEKILNWEQEQEVVGWFFWLPDHKIFCFHESNTILNKAMMFYI